MTAASHTRSRRDLRRSAVSLTGKLRQQYMLPVLQQKGVMAAIKAL